MRTKLVLRLINVERRRSRSIGAASRGDRTKRRMYMLCCNLCVIYVCVMS